jgi:DNA processing protein
MTPVAFPERAYWVAWLQVPRFGPVAMGRLVEHFGDLRSAWEAPLEAFQGLEGLGPVALQSLEEVRPTLDVKTVWEAHQRANPYFWIPGQPDYPPQLRDPVRGPALLYFAGQVDLREWAGELPMVAIVGTRTPSAYGRRWAQKLAMALAQRGFTVVSGMAEGIDAEAHGGALQAGGRTIAVLGTGLDVIYPSKNQGLYHQILSRGLVLTEYPAGTGPNRAHFPARNRLVAGLTLATIVIEAGEKSGALITAKLAKDLGRSVYVLPGSLDNPKSRGCLEFLASGDGQLIVTQEALLAQLDELAGRRSASKPASKSASKSVAKSASNSASKSAPASVAGSLQSAIPGLAGATAPVVPVATVPPPNLSPLLTLVWQAIGVQPCSFDQIMEAAELSAPQVSSSLVQLELLGVVEQLPGMRYQRV